MRVRNDSESDGLVTGRCGRRTGGMGQPGSSGGIAGVPHFFILPVKVGVPSGSFVLPKSGKPL